MSEREIKTNLKLSADFSDYVVKHPDIMRGVSSGSRIVFVMPSNPSLTEKNLKLAERIVQKEKRKVYKAVKTKNKWTVEPVLK
ncbi:MAG: hypothetical protein G01um101433_12 [Parcubacteria group bacterium Gr01-1014_33]|nr:MAG: hypothetical protein G01um101433_12 [Parcubacteria group bacterium Gr01-1014_33]